MSLLNKSVIFQLLLAFKYQRGTKDAVNCEQAGQHWYKKDLNRQFIQYAYNNRLYRAFGQDKHPL